MSPFKSSVIVTLSLLCAGAAGLWAWRGLGPAAPTGFVETHIGAMRLRVHQAYARSGDALRQAEAERLDLAARFPDFRPAGQGGRGEAEAVVFLRLQPQDTAVDPGERAAKLYVRFLEKDQWSHPGGLIMRRFEPGSPYEREELYFAPPEGRLFTARCMRPSQPPDGLPNTCISELRLRGLDVQVRYSPDLLPDWEQLMAGARGLVESMAR